jgi:hypothetical protein
MALTISACSLTQPQGQAPPSPAGTPSPSPSPAALKITSATFHSGEVGVDYSAVTLNGVGGVTPYTWTVSAGAMPSGLTISTNGTVSGTPKAAGTFHFTLQLADSAGANVKVAKSLGIARALRATLTPGCATQCLVEVGCVSVCGTFGKLTGGVGPFTYTSLGNIPPGVHLSGLALAGTFSSPGTRYWSFTVNITDSLGAHTVISPSFNVFPHLTFTGGSCVGTGTCVAPLQYTVGVSETPGVKVAGWTGGKTCGANGQSICPAPHFSASVQGGVVTVTVGPAVAPNLSTTGAFKLSLSDQFPCGPGVNCSATATLSVDLR